MKTIKCAVKIIAFLLIGTLFLSCVMDKQDDYGTLVVALPGSGARAAVSPEFTATLSYRIDCTGPGSVSRVFRAGQTASIPLATGSWSITVTVLNAANESINKSSATASANIESGKTTTVQVPITIDASRKVITHFAITWPVMTIGLPKIEWDDINDIYEITLTILPYSGNPYGQVDFNIIHTGRKLEIMEGTLQIEELHYNKLFDVDFIVTAEDDTESKYTIKKIEVLDLIGLEIEGLSVPDNSVWVFPASADINNYMQYYIAKNSSCLARSFSYNLSDFILFDWGKLFNISMSVLPVYDYRDLLWKGSGEFLVILTDEGFTNIRKAKVEFADGKGSAHIDDLESIAGTSHRGEYSVNVGEEYSFGTVSSGYLIPSEQIQPLTVTVTNKTSNQIIMGITLAKGVNSDFELGVTVINDTLLVPGVGDSAFIIQPKPGLAAGNYNDTLEVSFLQSLIGDGPVYIEVSFIVQ